MAVHTHTYASSTQHLPNPFRQESFSLLVTAFGTNSVLADSRTAGHGTVGTVVYSHKVSLPYMEIPQNTFITHQGQQAHGGKYPDPTNGTQRDGSQMDLQR